MGCEKRSTHPTGKFGEPADHWFSWGPGVSYKAFVHPVRDPSLEPTTSSASAIPAQRDMNSDILVIPDFGELRYNAETKNITAFCKVHRNTDCRKSRTCIGSSARARAGRGRPIGLLTAWVLKPDSHVDKWAVATLKD